MDDAVDDVVDVPDDVVAVLLDLLVSAPAVEEWVLCDDALLDELDCVDCEVSVFVLAGVDVSGGGGNRVMPSRRATERA